MSSESPAKPCDNASAGVVAEQDGRWLFIWRATWPFTVAPVSGHVFDEHKSYEDAAVAEMREEAGLTVESLHPTGVGGWRPNPCRRGPGPQGTGHRWAVYTAAVSGKLAPDPGSAKTARWLRRAEVQLLANRTVLHARGRVRDWGEAPGIEPVWVGWLAALDVVHLSVADLGAVAGMDGP